VQGAVPQCPDDQNDDFLVYSIMRFILIGAINAGSMKFYLLCSIKAFLEEILSVGNGAGWILLQNRWRGGSA
jgi:TM2 domain-containing membrane protein YozV